MLEDECYKAYLKNTEASIIECPKKFWSFVKSRKKGSSAIPSTLILDDQSADSGEGVANLFSNYFQSNFLLPSSLTIRSFDVDSMPTQNSPTFISNLIIERIAVHKLLEKLDLSKGAGPDDIVPVFIVKCAKNLSAPLALLFQRSIDEGLVPDIWKSAFITPIHKNGNKNDVRNYRPISKLCIFAKVFEKLVHTQVYSALSPLFINEQHGFIKNRSTTTNLLTFTEYTTRNMDAGGQVDAVFTDYSKAFDRIDHQILLNKLYNAGIHGNLFRWFTSYIKNRCQAVVVNGFASTWVQVPSGVPQGSLLGPLLFVLFINDISICFQNSEFILYADDMKVYRSVNTVLDCKLLQEDLYRFEEYCVLNKLDLNVSKCISITFTRKSKPVEFNYVLKNTFLKLVTDVRDLGVIQDSKLLYDKHVDCIFKKANRSMGFLKRTCSQFSSVKLIKVLYCCFVRSILEYCSQVWNPRYQVYVDRIESIQTRFLRYLQFKCRQVDVDYEARCLRHHILPLRERRRIADIAFLCKIAQTDVDTPQLLSNIKLRVPSRIQLREPLCLARPKCYTIYRHNSFFPRAVDAFNGLIDFPELDLFDTKPVAFKITLTRHWFDAHS